MRTVGAYEAKTHLADLLDAVAQGEQVLITRHGAPVAVLSPYGGASAEAVDRAIEDLLRLRRGRTLDVPVKQLVEEGRT